MLKDNTIDLLSQSCQKNNPPSLVSSITYVRLATRTPMPMEAQFSLDVELVKKYIIAIELVKRNIGKTCTKLYVSLNVVFVA